jgi:hypothetical protein
MILHSRDQQPDVFSQSFLNQPLGIPQSVPTYPTCRQVDLLCEAANCQFARSELLKHPWEINYCCKMLSENGLGRKDAFTSRLTTTWIRLLNWTLFAE